MTNRNRTLLLLTATAALAGGYSLYACATCGCSSKPKAAEKADCPTGVCSLSKAPKAAAHGAHDINTFQMKAHVDAGQAVLLDARSGQYDDGYRIPGAKSLNSKSSAAEIAAVIPSKDSLVVTYCSNLQCPASKQLADKLVSLGYSNVHEYPEGIAGWREAGGSVDKVK